MEDQLWPHIEALIAYRERRYRKVVEAAGQAQRFFAARQGKLGVYDRIGHDLTDALRAFSERSDG